MANYCYPTFESRESCYKKQQKKKESYKKRGHRQMTKNAYKGMLQTKGINQNSKEATGLQRWW